MSVLAQLRRPGGLRNFPWIVAAAVVGCALGVALIPRANFLSQNAVSDPPRLYGEALPTDGSAFDVALQRVRERISGWFNLELPDGSVRRIGYGALGVEIDRARLRAIVEAALGARDQRARVTPVEVSVPLRVQTERALVTLLALKDELDETPADARLDLDRRVVVPERAGRLLDVDCTLASVSRALAQGDEAAALAFEPLSPRRLASELDQIEHGALLGAFETPHDTAARAADRTFNLGLAASRLDGYVLMPGAEFDFNAVVGPRDEASGYQVAKVIAAGELVDGIGGGTCQISGTLHAAALLAGLDVVERHPHTRPSSYIKLGLDAAVVYPTINLRLRNPYDFPVVLRETVRAGRVRAEVRGARRPQTVTLIRRIDQAHPFDEVQRPDDTLPRGRRALAQRGVPGFDLHLYRIRREGAHAVRETVVASYPATPQIVRVGTGSSSTATGRPPHDVLPEYLADELLVLSQLADSDGPAVEQRTPGRFGSPGWTKEIGAPVWEPKGR